MAKKRTYSTVAVEQIEVQKLLPALLAGCIVALDVAKHKFVAAIATLTGEIVKMFRFEHPRQTHEFLDLVRALQRALEPDKELRVAMEPTGTYGDSIRHQLTLLGASVWMVPPKKTHDSRALFDDVASLHDPKSAFLVAKLCSMNLATKWEATSEVRQRLRALVDLRKHEADHQERCFGRLEARLARHWPELGESLDLHRVSTLKLLMAFPSPTRVAEKPAEADELLRVASRKKLSAETTAKVVTAAKKSFGLPAWEEDELAIKSLAAQAYEAERRANDLEGQLIALGSKDDAFQHLAPWMGAYTAGTIITHCDPREYATTRQLEKACGLNLREKSSGDWDAEHPDDVPRCITKRGPSLVRKLLYMFALRMINESPSVRAWYMRRRGYSGKRKMVAVIAVMRKLLKAVFHVARGATFCARKLFDHRRLNLSSDDSERCCKCESCNKSCASREQRGDNSESFAVVSLTA
jgi:transposase